VAARCDAALHLRRRIERDLHDGAQQRLVSVLLTLRLAHQTSNDSEALRVVLDEAIAGQEHALAELRELASGIHPAVLTEGGLGPALRVLAELAPVPVTLAAVPGERLPQPVEAAAYFVVAEALTNVTKHAQAHTVSIEVTHQDGRVCVLVADDGIGGADISKGSGLRGLADRVAAVDGHVVVVSPRDDGTRILATIPCA
jgi:signal transduction histidine kinase